MQPTNLTKQELISALRRYQTVDKRPGPLFRGVCKQAYQELRASGSLGKLALLNQVAIGHGPPIRKMRSTLALAADILEAT